MEEAMSKILELPFPRSELMPNRANGRNYRALSGIKKQVKHDAYMLTIAAGLKGIKANNGISIMFHTPDKRKRDLDNMLTAMKNALDGVALALGVDDSTFHPITIDRVYGGNKVVIEFLGDH